jgi:hypothetical protein
MSGAGSAEEQGILQRHGQGCVERSGGLEDPNVLLSAPTGVRSSLLHLRNSWKEDSSNPACMEFSDVHLHGDG